MGSRKVAKKKKPKVKKDELPVGVDESQVKLDAAITAIRHLRNVLKDYNKDHADHVLSATCQYEEIVDAPKD